MKKYKHVFFDLDRTLWDFDRCSRETMEDIFAKYALDQKGVPDFNSFITIYYQINDALWTLYRNGELSKEILHVKRFYSTLEKFGIDNEILAKEIADDYIASLPNKTHLFPYTHQILEYLSNRYTLHIITNGFEEVQYKKMESSGLSKYFDQIITSEDAGFKKPDKNIFTYSLNRTHSKAEESLMIGDEIEVDILGAKSVGMDQVLVNYQKIPHNEEITYEVFSLQELVQIL